MLQIPGPPALSAFRIAKLLDRLGALEPAVTGLAARFIHFAELAQPLSAPEREILAQLLTYGPRPQVPADAVAGECVLVVPRTGTISPWSSKATDIARVCGLEGVRRWKGRTARSGWRCRRTRSTTCWGASRDSVAIRATSS